MNDILALLTGGDLRSDGRADEVAEIILKNLVLFPELFEGLLEENDIVRGRAAHAIEKVSRIHPELFIPLLPQLKKVASEDKLPMVRWHLAMLFGNLVDYEEEIEALTTILLDSLEDRSVFVKSWAIVSLCIFGRRYPERKNEILSQLKRHQNDKSIAIRSKVAKAIPILLDNSVPMPEGWVKREG